MASAYEELKAKTTSLSEIERKALKAIANGRNSLQEIAEKESMNLDSCRRACAWLEEKKLIESREEKKNISALTVKGKEALDKGLPEEQLMRALGSKTVSFNELQEKTGLGKELNAAIGTAKKNAWITISKKENELIIEATGLFEETREKVGLKKELEKINSNQFYESGKEKELLQRGLIEKKFEAVKEFRLSNEGRKAIELREFAEQRTFNIQEPAPEIFIGKKQPYIQFLNSIRAKLVQMGFQEMNAPLIVPEFYNFDVLFQPQNHPARAWTDTYQLLKPKKGLLPDKSKVLAVKAAHESGGKSMSSGWGYQWSEEIAQRLMPAAHGTAHSARKLVEGPEIPAKYFAMARCFRPDVLDATHLIEFNQTEGFIVGKELNFRHLLSTLKEFAVEIADAKEVKFLPDYYPFTEPSVQLSAKHPTLGWVELGGAGMFRPEMLENLGVKGQAIAWGIGIDRLAMFKLGIKDIRYLFSNDLDWLRKTPLVMD